MTVEHGVQRVIRSPDIHRRSVNERDNKPTDVCAACIIPSEDSVIYGQENKTGRACLDIGKIPLAS